MKTKLLTRKEIIEIWNDQSEDFLNSYCCPNCRDILYNHPYQLMLEVSEEHYFCHNRDCANYNLAIERA